MPEATPTHPSIHRECDCGRWIAAPAVAAARDAARRARAEWNATAPPFGVTGDLNAEQRALHRRMQETDRAYVIARDIELSASPLSMV